MTDDAVNDEGADPSNDIKKQNPDETTTQDQSDRGTDNDANKVENLTKQGRDINPADGTE